MSDRLDVPAFHNETMGDMVITGLLDLDLNDRILIAGAALQMAMLTIPTELTGDLDRRAGAILATGIKVNENVETAVLAAMAMLLLENLALRLAGD